MLIEFEKMMNSTFDLMFSTYTAKMVLYSPTGEHATKLLTEKRPQGVFIASKLIERDLKNFTANTIPLIDETTAIYYAHNLREIELKKVVNVDISNAYASVLYLDGFISEDTYLFLQRVAKKDRLAAIGMLAYKRNVFNYVDGKLVSTSIQTGEYRSVFFYCVKRVNEIMEKCRKALGKNHLFTWVDGIYMYNMQSNIFAVCDVLAKEGLNYSIDILSDFKVELIGEVYFITFGGKKGNKVFQIPKHSYNLRNSFYEYFNQKNENTNF